MERIYEEIRCDYNPDGFWTVDAWEHDEPGKVIALINDVTGDYYAIDEFDDNAKQLVEDKSSEVKSLIADRIIELFENLDADDKRKVVNHILRL